MTRAVGLRERASLPLAAYQDAPPPTRSRAWFGGGALRSSELIDAGPARSSPASRELPAEVRREATVRFFDQLGLGADARLDRALLEDITTGYFAMDVPSAAKLRERLEAELAQKGTLGDFTAEVQRDLIGRHTPLSQFIALGGSDLQRLAQEPSVREVAARVAHHAFVLDTVVELMVADKSFAVDLRRHFYRQRRAKGIDLNRVSQLAGVFGAVKTATIDLVFKPILGMVVGLERTRESDRLMTLDFWAWGKSGVPLNIAEAMISGFLGRAYDNALAAYRLAVRTSESGRLGGENKELLLKYPAGWTELYETWNLLFVLDRKQSGLESPELLIAKLLIPSLTSVESDQYIYRRALALWVTIQTYLFQKNDGYVSKELGLPDAAVARLLETWGKSNRAYSEALASPKSKRSRKTL